MRLFKRCSRKPINIRIKIARTESVGNGRKEKFITIEEELDELLERIKKLEKKHGKINIVITVE